MVTNEALTKIRDYIIQIVDHARVNIAGTWEVLSFLSRRPAGDNKVVFDIPIPRNGQVTDVELYTVDGVMFDDRTELFTVELIDNVDALIYQITYTVSVG